MKTKRIIHKKVLPGEPLDGTGRVCIHLLVPDENGPFIQNHMLYVEEGEDEDGRRTRQLVHRPTRCRLACNPNRSAKPEIRNGIITITMHTDDPQAVTCFKCLASDGYAGMVKQHESVRNSRHAVPAETGR